MCVLLSERIVLSYLRATISTVMFLIRVENKYDIVLVVAMTSNFEITVKPIHSGSRMEIKQLSIKNFGRQNV